MICFSNSSTLILNTCSVFFSWVITSVWFFLIFSISLLKFSLCSFILLKVWWASLWPLLWILYWVDFLSLFHLVLFLRFYLIISTGTYSSASSFCLILCACFYVLGKSSNLEGVALFRGYPVRFRVSIPPGHQNQAPNRCPIGELRVPSCCDGLQMLLKHAGGLGWPWTSIKAHPQLLHVLVGMALPLLAVRCSWRAW